jgi:hypothetical protein
MLTQWHNDSQVRCSHIAIYKDLFLGTLLGLMLHGRKEVGNVHLDFASMTATTSIATRLVWLPFSVCTTSCRFLYQLPLLHAHKNMECRSGWCERGLEECVVCAIECMMF